MDKKVAIGIGIGIVIIIGILIYQMDTETRMQEGWSVLPPNPQTNGPLTINKDQYLEYLGIVDKSRKNILYAPTWKWGDGTLRRFGKKFCKEISRDYNLIIRPHFQDRSYIIKLKLWAKLNGLKHVYFSNPAKIIKQK